MVKRKAMRSVPLVVRARRERKTVISLAAIVDEGLLRPPISLWAQYRGHSLSATIQPDGSILVQGVRCTSPSSAAASARKPFFEGKLDQDRLPATNGWTFWQLQDPASNEMVPLETLRTRYRQRKKTEANRSGGGA